MKDNYIYIALNTYWEPLPFEIPGLPSMMNWHVSVNTGMPSPEDIWEPGSEPKLDDQRSIVLDSRSVVILTGH